MFTLFWKLGIGLRGIAQVNLQKGRKLLSAAHDPVVGKWTNRLVFRKTRRLPGCKTPAPRAHIKPKMPS